MILAFKSSKKLHFYHFYGDFKSIDNDFCVLAFLKKFLERWADLHNSPSWSWAQLQLQKYFFCDANYF